MLRGMKRTRSGSKVDRAYKTAGLLGLAGLKGLASRLYPVSEASTWKPKAVNKRTGGRMNKELKYNDSFQALQLSKNIATSNVDPTTNQNLTGLAQGDGPQQRIGRVTFIRSLYVQGNIEVQNPPSSASHFYVTIWLVEDMQTNRTLFTPTDFVDALNPAVHADAFQNLDNSDRFRLHKKKVVRITCRSRGSTDVGVCTVPFSIYKKCNVKVQHQGPGALIGNINTSSFHLLACLSENAPTQTHIRYQCRVRFTD